MLKQRGSSILEAHLTTAQSILIQQGMALGQETAVMLLFIIVIQGKAKLSTLVAIDLQ